MSHRRGAGEAEVQAVAFNGSTFRVGDCVTIRGESKEAYVARIRRFWQPADPATVTPENTTVEVSWFYRPEEVESVGRLAFHGAREVLDSDHVDAVSFATVIGSATVHSLASYLAARARDSLADDDYYARFTARVKAERTRLEPERVPVHCVCGTPFNPDLPYVTCATCGDVFHPGCLGMNEEGAAEDLPPGWACERCVAKEGAASA